MLNMQRDHEELLRARKSLQATILFLRGGDTGDFHLIEPSLSFESGALYAIEWALGLEAGELFAAHLGCLKAIESRLVGEADDAG